MRWQVLSSHSGLKADILRIHAVDVLHLGASLGYVGHKEMQRKALHATHEIRPVLFGRDVLTVCWGCSRAQCIEQRWKKRPYETVIPGWTHSVFPAHETS